MREGWELKPLSSVCRVKPPKREVKKLLQDDSQVSFVPMSHLEVNHKYFSPEADKLLKDVYKGYTYFRNGDVLLAKITPCFENGKLGIAHDLTNGIGFGSSEYVVYRPSSNILSDYLYYFLMAPDFRYTGEKMMGGAVGHQRIPKEFYEGYEIPIPPLPEQKRIVAILDEAFEAIDRARANIEKNIRNAEELFQSKLNEIFSQKGEGWEALKLKEVITLKSGTTISKKLEIGSGDIPYLKVSDLNLPENNFFATTSTKFIDEEEVKGNKIFPSGTVIFPKRGGAIATNKKRLTKIPICADLNIMGAIPNEKILPMYLLYYFLKFDLEEISNGTSVPQINNYSFDNLYISVPSDLEKQAVIVDAFESFRSEINKYNSILEQKLFNLEELKKSLLRKAFSGELTANEPMVA